MYVNQENPGKPCFFFPSKTYSTLIIYSNILSESGFFGLSPKQKLKNSSFAPLIGSNTLIPERLESKNRAKNADHVCNVKAGGRG